MAQPRSSGRGGAATKARVGNKTPGTPEFSESKIYRMRVDEIRDQLRRRGVTGTSGQRKDELVKSLINAMKAEIRGGRAPAKKATPKKTTAKRTTAKKTTAPAGKRTAAAQKSTAPARKTAAKKTTATAGRGGAAARKSTATKRSAAGASRGSRAGTGESRSLKYAQRISSPDDRPERPGRSLVTSDREVIRRWAQARDAQPATIEGTEREGRAGVLTFDFPGYRSGGRLRQISWDEWLGVFEGRRLNFIYQEQMTNQRQSNFFRLESPDREDA
ncbi:MAG TPA: hypothetical protein VF462_04535 [Micromonosporaceae bacterium]